jgi:hypothetical protein
MKRSSKALRRLRLILPSDATLLSWVAVFLIAEAPVLFQVFWVGRAATGPYPARYVLMFASIALGIRRVMAFHPYFSPDYLAWLSRTPWTRGKPLPGGPVFLVPEDVLIVGGLSLLALTQPEFHPLAIATRFLLAYLTTLAVALWGGRASSFGYLTIFGVGLSLRLWPDPQLSLLAAALTLPVAMLGLWTSLAEFPWEGSRKMVKIQMNTDLSKIETPDACGWPYDTLAPRPPASPPRSLVDKILISLTIGWLLYALCGPLQPDERFIAMGLALTSASAGLILIRFYVYKMGNQPPISLWGRLRTLRPIVPGYDQMYLGPLFTAAALLFSGIEFHRMDLPRDVWIPMTIAFAVLVNYTTGPSLLSWRLTGKFRMVPQQKAGNTEFVQTN